MAHGFFITGTDTGAGKTQVAASLLKRLKHQGYTTAGLKPVSSGCIQTAQGLRNEDALSLQSAATCQVPYDWINPFAFEPAIAPHLAAKAANCRLSTKAVFEACQPLLNSNVDYIIIEGAGGLLVPLNATETFVDLAKKMDFPIILVVGLRLGCINHSLLTLESIRHHSLKVAGWIGYPLEPIMPYLQENIEDLKSLLKIPYLGLYPEIELSFLRSQVCEFNEAC